MLFVIYGSNTVHLKSEQSETATCPGCGTKGSLVFSVYRKHAHVFWIPLFPIGKTGGAVCQHCKHSIKAKEMPDEVKAEYNDLKKEATGPIWQFVGLAIIGGLVVWISMGNLKDNRLEKEYISAPAAGDVYEYKIADSRYSTLKVIDVSQDSVYVAHNEYEIDKSGGINILDKDSNYGNFMYGISRALLTQMHESGEILVVKRLTN